MRSVRVIYHDDPDGWWAESPDVAGYTAFGTSYEEVRDEIREGLPWFAEEDLMIFHIQGDVARGGLPPKVSLDLTRSPRSTYRALALK